MKLLTEYLELRRAHKESLALAQAEYDDLIRQEKNIVITESSGDGWTAVSAAGPGRIAWEVYFDAMLERGQKNPWKWRGYERFNRGLKR